MIIVEGPDGAGKSTLLDQLRQRFPEFALGERGTKDRTKLWTVTRSDTYNALALAINAKETEPLRVWDRLFYSELVYPQRTGRKGEFSVPEVNFIRRMIGAMGCPVIVCLPPLENVQENVKKAKQMSGVVEAIDKIWGDYRHLFKATAVTNVLWYDYTGTRTGSGFKTYDEITRHIHHYLQLRETRTTS